MTANRFLLLALLAAAPACTDDDGSSPADDSPHEAAECTPNDYGTDEILACGFGPKLALLGIDTQRIYAASEYGTLYALDRDAGTTMRLYHGPFTDSLQTSQAGSVIHDGHIIFPGHYEDGASIGTGFLSIDGATEQDAPTVLARGDQFEPMAGVVDDGTRIYASSIEHADFSAFSGRVVAMPYGGGPLSPVTPDSGTPIDVSGGYLYYLHDHDVKRISLAGGAAETVATSVAFTAWANRAVDTAFLYGSPDASPYDLVGFPVVGGSPHPLTTLTSNVEVPTSPAHDLHIDGEWLYFMRSSGEDPSSSSYVGLYRIHLDGTGEPEQLAQGQDMLAPVFDGDWIYLAYTRGGYDAPIEGVIARIPKHKACAC